MLKKYSLKALEKAMNQALNLDKDISRKLRPLDNRVLEVIILPLQVNFFMQFQNSQIHLLATYEGTPDTTIKSSPLGLIRLSVLPVSKARSLFNDSISLSGNTELGQEVKALFDSLHIDWEGYLADFTGDVVAYQIGSFLRNGLAQGRRLGESLRFNTQEFVQEEAALFPSRLEVEDFFAEVDNLALDVERLQAAMHHLETTREKS